MKINNNFNISSFNNQQGVLAVPSIARNLTTGTIKPTSIIWNWDAPTDDGGDAIDYYYIRWFLLSDTVNPLGVAAENVLTYESTALSASTEYFLKVRPHNHAGLGPTATLSAETNAPL
jgi:hypothetical protein